MAISNTNVVKMIVVTDDIERTAGAYKRLLGTGKHSENTAEDRNIREPYTKYMGENITDTPMKVYSIYSDNFWIEVIQPLGNNDPWAKWLSDHGTSVYSICFMSEGPIEKDEEFMKNEGYESIFKQEKGFEAYEYFDTAKALGTLIEIKEHY